MDDNRRGFLKSMITAGAALILPNQEKKIILPTEVVEPPPLSDGPPCYDLGDCIVIPKKNIRGWQANVHNNYTDFSTIDGRSNRVFESSYLDVTINAVFCGDPYLIMSNIRDGQQYHPEWNMELVFEDEWRLRHNG